MQKCQCLDCEWEWDIKPKTGAENFVNFILFAFSIYLLFAFFPLAFLAWGLIWLLNQNKCPKCRGKRIANADLKK